MAEHRIPAHEHGALPLWCDGCAVESLAALRLEAMAAQYLSFEAYAEASAAYWIASNKIESARRACAACDADAADIGRFDHGIAHTLVGDCRLSARDVDSCGRIGNHALHGTGER